MNKYEVNDIVIVSTDTVTDGQRIGVITSINKEMMKCNILYRQVSDDGLHGEVIPLEKIVLKIGVVIDRLKFYERN